MDFTKPIRFIRRHKGKDEYLDIVPNQLSGWKTLETIRNGLMPEKIWLDEKLIKPKGKE